MPEPNSQQGGDLLLAQRLLAGEEPAFEELAQGCFGPLYRFALARLDGDEELAADLVQETLATALRKLETFRGDSTLLTWMCGICRFEISSHFRRKGRAPEVVELKEEESLPWISGPAAEPGPDPARELERKEVAGMVHRILDELPVRYGQALEWKYLEGLPVAEIAERLGVGPKAAESVLSRARKAFQEGFEALSRSPGALRQPQPWTSGRNW